MSEHTINLIVIGLFLVCLGADLYSELKYRKEHGLRPFGRKPE